MSEITQIYEDENFSVQVEEEEGFLFLHCSVESFGKDVYKRMSLVMEELKDAFFFHGWDEIFSYTQNPKFSEKFGFQKIGQFEKDSQIYEVMLCRLQ